MRTQKKRPKNQVIIPINIRSTITAPFVIPAPPFVIPAPLSSSPRRRGSIVKIVIRFVFSL